MYKYLLQYYNSQLSSKTFANLWDTFEFNFWYIDVQYWFNTMKTPSMMVISV